MKNIIAIFFLSLLCLASIPGQAILSETGYELISGCEIAEKEKKDSNKEIKDFINNSSKNLNAALNIILIHKVSKDLIFLQPAPGKPTPPPDPAC